MQVKAKRSTIFKRISDGNFPKPIGGTQRACWPQHQINDYIYQLYRFGSWSRERADEAFDKLNSSLYQPTQVPLSQSNAEIQSREYNSDSPRNYGDR